MTAIYRFILLIVLMGLSACATVTRGTHERVRFETEPPGAKVTTLVESKASKAAREIDPSLEPEFYSCEPTPCEIKLHRRTNTVATLSHPGYETLEFAITSGISKRAIAPSATGTVAVGAGLTTFAVALGGTVAVAAAPIAAITGGVAVVTMGPDLVTGAAMRLSPNPMSIHMVTEGTPVIPDPDVQKLYDKGKIKLPQTMSSQTMATQSQRIKDKEDARAIERERCKTSEDTLNRQERMQCQRLLARS